MDNLKHFAHGMFKRAAEAVTPPLASSQFAEKRVGLSCKLLISAHHCSAQFTCCLAYHKAAVAPYVLQVLTPEEFVKAGDYLVRACPTWSW